MKVLRRLWCLGTLILVLLSCSKMGAQEYYMERETKVRTIVESIAFQGGSVETVVEKDGMVFFSLSGNTVFSLSEEITPVVRIGLDGHWVVNGMQSDFLYEECAGVDVGLMHTDLIRYSDDASYIPMISCIVEGYTDWTFFFSDGDSVSLIKTSHCYDFDSILRGVNHRGFCIIAPENTLPAFRLSRLQGFTFVETDVHFSSDGIPVCIHDSNVARTSNGYGVVSEMTLEQLRKLDFGSWKGREFADTVIPTLEEFLTLCRSIGLIPYIELKDGTKEQVALVVSLVNKYGFSDKAVYISFKIALLSYVLDSDLSARVGYLTSVVNEDTIKSVERVRSVIMANSFDNRGAFGDQGQVFIDSSDYRIEVINLCKNSGIPLEVWTVDSVGDILSLPPYVSGVTSNSLHAGRVIKEVME